MPSIEVEDQHCFCRLIAGSKLCKNFSNLQKVMLEKCSNHSGWKF